MRLTRYENLSVQEFANIISKEMQAINKVLEDIIREIDYINKRLTLLERHQG